MSDTADESDIYAAVRTAILKVGGTGDPGAVLRGLDSLGLVELVVEIEQSLAIEIPDEALNDRIFESDVNLGGAILALKRAESLSSGPGK